MTDAEAVPTVYEALTRAIDSLGFVAPDGLNTNQGFSFRSIDGVVGAVRPVLIQHNLTIIPSFESLEQIDYPKSDGRVYHRSVLLGTFTVIGPDGSNFAFTTVGEAMDTEGRASNKAMSAATKNAYIRLFQIGSGSDDGDGSDTVPAQAPRAASAPASDLAGRVAAAGGAVAAQGGPDSGELLTEGQGKNLYRLWKYALSWDRDRFLQEVELVTGAKVTDDRKLTKKQASDMIRALKIRAGEPVDDTPATAPSTEPAPDDSYFDDSEPF